MLRLATAFLLTLGQAVNDVLQMDDQCDSGDCSLELIHLRGQRQDHAIRLINHQIEDNKKYEVAVADDSAATCSPEGGAQITCAETHKCCTSKRSYLAGTAHESQPRLALYAICCPLDTHCKFDTIFVSCAPGAGPDDYSGVIAGLQYNQNEKAEMNQDAVALINHQIEDNKKYEVAVADDSAATCSPEGGAQITCAETHKCCTSKRSYLAGTAHQSQPRLALYAICCPLDTHCKFDTIFVSCAPGAGPDDYSGVIAG